MTNRKKTQSETIVCAYFWLYLQDFCIFAITSLNHTKSMTRFLYLVNFVTCQSFSSNSHSCFVSFSRLLYQNAPSDLN